MPWYVVLNSVGLVLAVYGSALEREARTNARRIATEAGFPVTLGYAWFEHRPRVGSPMPTSMRGESIPSAWEIVRPE